MKEFKRNLKSLNNKTGELIKSELNNILAIHDKYKKCYFWTQNGNAASRRRQEFDTLLKFKCNEIEYTISQTLSISCANFYYNCDIRKDGNKSNVTAINKLIN